jgi:hypothetical protein
LTINLNTIDIIIRISIHIGTKIDTEIAALTGIRIGVKMAVATIMEGKSDIIMSRGNKWIEALTI